MPRSNYTDITIILDRSQSMEKIRDGTVRGINAFVDEQRRVPGEGCWSLVQFDDPASARGAGEDFPLVAFSGRPEAAVPKLTLETFKPRGNTALIDAACKTIDATGRRLAAMPEHERPSRVLMVIMTDGEENSSAEFTAADLAERRAHQESKYGWQFVFLGANLDAIAEAAKYGIAAQNSHKYAHTAAGTVAAMGLVSRATRSWKADGNDTAGQFVLDPEKVTT